MPWTGSWPPLCRIGRARTSCCALAAARRGYGFRHARPAERHAGCGVVPRRHRITRRGVAERQRDRPTPRSTTRACGQAQQRGAAVHHCCFDDPSPRPSACSRPSRAQLSKHLPFSGCRCCSRLGEQHSGHTTSASRCIYLWPAEAMQQSAARGATTGSRPKRTMTSASSAAATRSSTLGCSRGRPSERPTQTMTAIRTGSAFGPT
jgi:hypothetical protein